MEQKSPHEYQTDFQKQQLQRTQQSRAIRFLYDVTIHLVVYGMFFFTPDGWSALANPRRRRLLSRRARHGLLEGTIIQNPLYIPRDESNLEMRTATAGQWVAYDFERPDKLGHQQPVSEGVLYSLLVNWLDGYSRHAPTPIFSIDVLSSDIFAFERPSVEYLIQKDILESATYEKAYRRVGRYDAYARAMEVLGISDKEVFQVTPKGNGVVRLGRDGGDTSKVRNPRLGLLGEPIRT